MGINKENKLASLELSAFFRQIAMVVHAGISTYEGLSILKEDATSYTKAIFDLMLTSMEEGGTFAFAIESTHLFPSYAVKMIRIGEETGKLEQVLQSLSDYYEREHTIQEGIKHALTYPLIMSGLMLLVLFVLIIKVLPVFQTIYAEFGSDLSGFALVMVNFSNSLSQYYVFLLAFLALVAISLFAFFCSTKGKKLLSRLPINRDISISHFANTMALSLSSGLDTDQGLSMALSLSNHEELTSKISLCQDMLLSGKSFSDAVSLSNIFSGIERSMILIGGKTGHMDDVMATLSKNYEDAADQKISRFLSFLEPSLVILLSVLIGAIMLTFLVPLLGIISTLG